MADVIETDYTTDPPTITERGFTPEELAQREADRIAFEQAEAERVKAEETRAALRASAEAKLKKLGLTLDEIATIVP
ncbi:MAG TPA: hypothetical protein VLA24_15185 [Pseudomonadales bacterium]|nr:hypothetical protein [Pseudomonadales bacterium]